MENDPRNQTGAQGTDLHDDFFEKGDKGQVSDDLEMAQKIKRRPVSRRNPVISVLVIVLSLYLMWDMRSGMIFFLKWPEPAAIGKAEDPIAANLKKDNSYVAIRGIPDPRKAQIQVTTFGVYSTYNIFFAYMGSEKFLVREKITELEAIQKNIEDYDSMPRVGRLFSFKAFPDQAELRQVRKYFKEHFNREFNEDSAWVILAGERPWKSMQYPLIYLVLVSFIGYNGWSLYRRYREK
jgi:hypothetical protein